MKTFLCLLLSLLAIQFSIAQSITLSPSTPGSPTKGTVVFDNATDLLKYWNGTAWIPITNAASGTGWALNGTHIHNGNTGNVGVGITTPKATFNVGVNKTVLFGADSTGAGSKFIWYPSKGALRAGVIFDYNPDNAWSYTNVGQYSVAFGYNTVAGGPGAVAMGYQTYALYDGCTAMGTNTTASGSFCTAMGTQTLASGGYSTAMGYNTKASNNYTTAMGASTTASAEYATALGFSTTASSNSAVAMGALTTASGNYSTAMGASTTASGSVSTATGYGTIASTEYSTAMGSFNLDIYDALLMIGNGVSDNSRHNVMTIMKNGNVGIGTVSPLAPLHIGNSASLDGTTNHYFSWATGTTIGTLGDGFHDIGLLVNADIVTKNSFVYSQTVTTSDARIKNVVGLSDNKEDLALLQKIQITDYHYKDVVNRGSQTFKKVIAQQVEAIYPEAVKKITSVIPDIYILAESVVYDATAKNLNITLAKDYGIKAGDKIQLVHPIKGEQLVVVESVLANSFRVKNWPYATEKLFVYGREVNDFRTVDYEALSMLGISAIQQLSKEVEELKKQNSELKTSFMARLEALENRMAREPIK